MYRQKEKRLLSDVAVKNAKPGARTYKLADGRGLYLLVHPNGGRYWRMDYRFEGKRKTLSFGVYPDVTLKMARARRDEARRLIADGVDPAEIRKAKKEAAKRSRAEKAKAAALARLIDAGRPIPDSFEAVAREWYDKHAHTWADTYSGRVLRRLEIDVFPYLGRIAVSEITSPVVLETLRRIEARGAIETAHRVKRIVGQVMRYAVATGRASNDPTAALKGALATPRKKHFASVTAPKEIAPLLRVLWHYQGNVIVRAALRIAPYVFVRPGELRHMKWADIDLNAGLWTFTASKTKTPHMVPLARQVVDILKDLHPLTGHGVYVFPSTRTYTATVSQRPMSENTVNAALRRMGIDTKKEITGHGFRAMARTVLAEVLRFPPEYIEMQLAHTVRDPLGRAYNRTQYIEDRVHMMQEWADYLDALREGDF